MKLEAKGEVKRGMEGEVKGLVMGWLGTQGCKSSRSERLLYESLQGPPRQVGQEGSSAAAHPLNPGNPGSP